MPAAEVEAGPGPAAGAAGFGAGLEVGQQVAHTQASAPVALRSTAEGGRQWYKQHMVSSTHHRVQQQTRKQGTKVKHKTTASAVKYINQTLETCAGTHHICIYC
jgi:hypothetical protein